MSDKSFKKAIQRADLKLKAGCQRIPKKTRIILVILFLISCGLFSLYQTISSLYQIKSSDKASIQRKELPVQSEQTEQESMYRSEERRVGKECRSWWWEDG